MDMKRFFLYFIVITALALAGCGGNGGGTPTDPTDPTPTTHDVTVPMLPMGYDSNPADTFTVAPGGNREHGDVTYSCPTGGPACEIEVKADGMVTSTGGAATAERSAASIARETDDQMAAAAAATKAAGTKRMAIATEAATAAADDRDIGGSDASLGTDNAKGGTGAAADQYQLSISRDRSGTEIEITDSMMAGANDPKFMQAMDLGGGTTMHVRTMNADDDGNVEEEVVMVTTDIEAPRATRFGLVANQILNENPATTGGTDYRGLRIVTGDTVETGAINTITNVISLTNVRGPAAAATGGTQTIMYTDLPGTADVNERRFTGTYNGADGTYVCTGSADCTATTNDEGVVSAMGGTWTFTPDSGATSDVADADYMYYGFWLKRTTDSDGVLTYDEVETYAGSSLVASIGSELNNVTGSATYSGGATGVYVHSVANPDGTEASATSGHFTADANLTAYFGQTVDDTTTTVDEAGRLAPSLLNTITGTIDNFMLSGGEANGWSVNLQGTRAAGENTVSGTASGGLAGSMGSFSGTYHGETPETASTGDGTNRVAPGVVVGEFNSVFSNGSVAGGFGARKQ